MRFDRNGWKLVAVFAVVAATALMTTSTAMAQGAGRQRGGGGFGMGGPLMLLQNEAVQKELGLTEDQVAAVSKINVDRPARADMQNMSQEERTQKMTEYRDKLQKAIGDILKPDQNQRLEEISLQLAGARALTQPDVSEKLGLTDDQKAKLADIVPQGRGQGGGGGNAKGGGGGGPGGMQAQREEQLTKALDVLTDDQKAQFEKMQGKKFDVQQLFRGRGQGGGNAPGAGKAPDA